MLKAIARRVKDSCKSGERPFGLAAKKLPSFCPLVHCWLPVSLPKLYARAIEKLSVMDRKSGQRLNAVTASFGVTEYVTNDSYENILRRADEQLYRARLGRNRVMPMSL